MPNAAALPQARLIAAKIGPSITTLVKGPRTSPPPVIGLLYTVAFSHKPNFRTIIEAVSAAFKEAEAGNVDFLLPGGPLLVVEPDIDPNGDMYTGLKLLQKLFRPRIPRSALVYEVSTTAREWHIQMSILGGFLPEEEIAAVRAAITKDGTRVTMVIKSQKQQADVFAISVVAADDTERQRFLRSLHTSCGVFATLQKIP